MSFATFDQYVTKLPGQRASIYKEAMTTSGGSSYDQFTRPGHPHIGTGPNTVGGNEIPTKANPGALPFDNAPVGKQLHLSRMTSSVSNGGMILYDRLWHGWIANGVNSGGLLQSYASSPIVDRSLKDDFSDVELWFSITTGDGTGRGWRIYFEDENGAARDTGSFIVNAFPVNRQIQVNAQQFHPEIKGIRRVTGFQWNGTGSLVEGYVVLARRIAEIRPSGAPFQYDEGPLETGLPIIPNDACLSTLMFTASTSQPQTITSINLAEGDA